MARQMGFSQAIPAPYSMDPNKQICRFVPHSFKEIRSFLSENMLTRTSYDPLPATRVTLLQKGSNPNGVHPKSTSASEKPRTAESTQLASGDSLNDASSRSKESSNSNKTKKAIPDVERIERPVIPEPGQSLNIIQNQEKSPCGLSSEGYSLSSSLKSAEETNPFLEEIDKVLGEQVKQLSSPLKEKDLIREDKSITPNVPIQLGLNKRIQIDPIIQFQEKLEEARAASVEKVKQSMMLLPSIPIIEIDTGGADLDDLLNVISETKAGSEQVISNSDNKSVQQEKGDTPIQKAISESLKMVLLKSAAERLIRLMSQPLDMLQKDPYWNDELVKVTSCLVEQQFPEKYRAQVSCFENLFLT
ncbi:hypothetical protein PIB30_096855 [Stylosanthes scabra]|uniref:Uncharacterized protein n=1 Tax=Stylosanthes scabra TaxID=79078 RepID=A0ABU6XYK8_9FABA|nr:hypothetical protein [Stylosanthes scabra]